MTNVKFLDQKIKISNKQYVCADYWEEISGEVWNNFEGDLKEEYRFETFTPLGPGVKENGKIVKFKLHNFKKFKTVPLR